MAKAFGVLLIVALIWIGLEFYLEGPARAFGGVFASSMGQTSDPDEEDLSTPKRLGADVERAHRESDERRDRALAE